MFIFIFITILPENLDIDLVRKKLLAVAKEDDVLTIDEGILIQKILQDIDKYITILDTALDDGILTHGERLEIFHQRSELMAHALRQAKIDDDINEDEVAILEAITTILNEYEENLRSQKE